MKAELRHTPGPIVFGVIGAALGAIGFPFLLLPTFQRALLGVLDGPVLWIASIGVGMLSGPRLGAGLGGQQTALTAAGGGKNPASPS